jgi:hypothetical protein
MRYVTRGTRQQQHLWFQRSFRKRMKRLAWILTRAALRCALRRAAWRRAA